MKTVALTIGHGPEIDKGAENPDGTNELGWNRELVTMIADELEGYLEVHIVHREVERVSPTAEVNCINPDFAIEFHLNSFNRLATGTEMIFFPGSVKGKRLAELCLRRVVHALRLVNRGIKGPQSGGRGMPFLRNTRCPAVIAESFFIDNSRDLSVGNLAKAELAAAYAQACTEFAATL